MAKKEAEVWKPHPEYTGIEVSTLGRVRTLDKLVSCRGNGTRLVKGRVLKPWDTRGGYLQVSVKVDGKWTAKRVNRLVAQAFLPNPKRLPQVNHKDCDRKNNKVENLEFCTASYNQKYRSKYGVSQTEAVGHHLFAVNLSTLEVSHFRSQMEASRALGIFNQNISNVIKGSRNQAGGFWFTNDDNNMDDTIKQKLYEIKHRSTLKMH